MNLKKIFTFLLVFDSLCPLCKVRLGSGFLLRGCVISPQKLALLRFLAKNAKKFKYHLVTRQDQNKSFPATLLSSVRKIEVILGEQEGEKKMAFLF